MSREADQSIRVDSMRLGYEAFQSCRHAQPETALFLEILCRVLVHVRQTGELMVEMPRSWLEGLAHWTDWGSERRDEDEGVTLDGLAETGRRLFALVELAADESSRLWAAGQRGPVRSLGYAMHNIPYLVRRGDEFNRDSYQFCFRVAAFHWGAYSSELQRAFCDLMGYDREQAERLVHEPQFAIEMFGRRRDSSGPLPG